MKKQQVNRVDNMNTKILLGYASEEGLMCTNPKFKEYLRKFYKQLEEEPSYTVVDGISIQGTLEHQIEGLDLSDRIKSGFALYVDSSDICKLNAKEYVHFYCKVYNNITLKEFFAYKKLCFKN